MVKSEKWLNAIKKSNTKHGFSDKERLYDLWCHMKQRCQNPTDKRYSLYGGRGITICEEWSDYSIFRKWALSNGYANDLTLDRIDNNGNYEPSNCRWTTQKVQSNNRRTNRIITHNGVSHTLSEWSDITGIKWCTIRRRIEVGWSVEQALTTPVYGGRKR